jgi:PAS domain S-box-containing protein
MYQLMTVLVGAVAAAAIAWALRARRALALSSTRARELEAGRLAQQETAARTESLLRTIVETAPMAVVLCAEQGRIMFTNRAARELFFEDTAVEGENFLRMIERAPEPLRRALLSDGDELFTVDDPQGSETFQLSKRYLDDGQTLIAVRHVTEEVNRQEIAALKKVIRVIGHEVSNSLGPISSLISSGRTILQRPEHLGRLATVFDTVEERAAHLQSFLEGYARLARLPAPQPAVISWQPFLEGLRGLWPQLTIEGSASRPGFFDRAQLQQVLINLIKNAHEAGGPEREVKLAITSPPEGGVLLAVLDRGPGMTDEVLHSALLPFFTTKPGGSGLGLALCREIVDLHRGQLRLGRREGGGMAVSVWLPDQGGMGASLAHSRARLTLTRA